LFGFFEGFWHRETKIKTQILPFSSCHAGSICPNQNTNFSILTKLNSAKLKFSTNNWADASSMTATKG
jgi:hypothetical protein